MFTEGDTYEDLENSAFTYNEGQIPDETDDVYDEEDEVDEYDEDEDFDSALYDFDFSSLTGKDFKKSFSKASRKIEAPRNVKAITRSTTSAKPTTKQIVSNKVVTSKRIEGKPVTSKRVENRPATNRVVTSKRVENRPVINKPISKNNPIKKPGNYTLQSDVERKINRIIVPGNKNVIVEGISKFILSQNKKDNVVKNIGYYKGKKLKELVLIFNNNSALDFNLELFNPSMLLDYLYSTSLNLNDKIQVAGGEVSYSDVVHYLVANPTMICNCKFVFSGPTVTEQIGQTLIVKNKSTDGTQIIHPLSLPLQIDTMQVAKDIVFFDIMDMLNRPFIPDGMDVIQYKVKPQMTVTMAFFYKQISLKKVFFKEARDSKDLM